MRAMRTVFLSILVAHSGTVCFGQTGDVNVKKEVSIEELRVPSSPAFTMLGVAPTEVERPSTPRALALSLVSATERSGSGIPTDIAMEFTPYWWKSHPDLTFSQYYADDKGIGDTIAQTLAVSLGTTDLEDQAGVSGARTALGLRFMLRQGKRDPDLQERVVDLQKEQLKLLECVPDEPKEPMDEACISAAEHGVRKARERVAEKAQRVGWTVEFAAAATRDFPENDSNQGANTRVGGWLTGSYSHGGLLSVVTLARYLTEDDATAAGHSVDVGGRLIMKGDGDGGMPPLAISLEALRRFASEGDDSSRVVAVLEYRLPVENLSLVASYGKDFTDLTGEQSLVSTLGINFGLGKGPVVKTVD
jgi:hypothetical protein